MFNMAKFSDRLGDIMFDKDTSTAALSKAVGVSKSTIYRYLKGQRVPETEILIRIADYFHCTIPARLGGKRLCGISAHLSSVFRTLCFSFEKVPLYEISTLSQG